MPTTAQLRELEHAEWALVLVVEDLPYAWTTHGDLVGTSLFADRREVLPGLVPFDYELGLDANADFQLERIRTTITIEDFDGRLAEQLGGFDGTEDVLFPSVLPTDDLVARTELHGRQVGNEAIGSSGERNAWPAVIGWSRPRLHVGGDYELDDVAPAPVSPRPVVLEGRRVVLYRLFRDHVTYPDRTAGFGSWRPIAEAERRWWGVLAKAGHTIDGREWTLQCDGPESWIYKRLGMLSQERPVRVWAPMVLVEEPGNDETRIRVSLTSAEPEDEANLREYGETFYTEQLAATDTIGLRAEVASIIATTALAAGGLSAFVDDDGQTVSANVATGEIQIRIEQLPVTRYATMVLGMHEKAWKRWGIDPQQQNALPPDDERSWLFVYNDVSAPGPGYWEAFITTKPGVGTVAQADNGGLPRVWKPLYRGGTMVLEAGAGQVLRLGDDIVHHAGQHDRPPLGDPDDPTYPLDEGVNRHGYWLVYGPRRFAGSEDDFEEMQIAEASWREPAQDLAQVAGDPPQIVVQRWLNPRRWGLDRDRLTTAWVALQNDERTVYARPLLRLGYTPHDAAPPGDQAHVVLQRLLYTTGTTPGWSGYEGGDPTLAATSNEPTGAFAGQRLDGEHEDLGCAVPADFIAPPATWDAFAARISNALRRVSLMIAPGMQTEALFRGLMTPRGWGWSLAGGRYGLLDIAAPLSPAGAIVLDYRRKRTGNDNVRAHKGARQSARAFTPKDKYTLRYDWNPMTGEFNQTLSQRSPDRGSRYRPYPGDDRSQAVQSASEHVAEAHGSRNAGGWPERMADVARWYDRGQSWIDDYDLMRRPGQDLWPGSVVMLTEPRAVDPAGTYGLFGAVGIVTRIRARDGGRAFTAKILVDGASTTRLRFNAPSARARGYDPATRRILVYDDWLGIGGDHSDAEHFVEPSWSSLGGQAVVRVRQWSGQGWRVTCSGTVDSVITTPGSSAIVLTGAGLSGTYYRDDDAVVTLHPTQTAAWVLAFHSPICDEDRTWGAGAAGYPWT